MNLSSLPTTGRLISIPGGMPGVKRTLSIMVSLARTYKTDLNVRNLAVGLVQHCAPKDKPAELSVLQHFCRDQIRYVNDIDGVETIQTPVQTLKLRAGDCDDKSLLLAALAASIGFSTRFCAIGVRGGGFSHVMMQARMGEGWLNCETIVPDVEVGWFPPDATLRMFAHV